MKKKIKSMITFLGLILLLEWVFCSVAIADWKIDFSRRGQDRMQSSTTHQLKELRQEKQKSSFLGGIFSKGVSNEVVILNTEVGFVPKTLRLEQGQKYRIHVVNVNSKEKNVSFMLDAFSEHHATYYGSIRSFIVEPKKEGVFSFQCPETGGEGKMVVHYPTNPAPSRGVDPEMGSVNQKSMQTPTVRMRQPAAYSLPE